MGDQKDCPLRWESLVVRKVTEGDPVDFRPGLGSLVVRKAAEGGLIDCPLRWGNLVVMMGVMGDPEYCPN